MTLNGGQLHFSEGAVLDLQGNELVLNAADITLVISDASQLTEQYALFINSAQSVELDITVKDANGNTLGTAKGGASVASIPEPTTATLSLLALAALVARRRR